MTQYLLSVHTGGGAQPAEPMTPEKYQHVLAMEEMKAAGAWLFAGRLTEPDVATMVRVSAGDALTTDGPFVESKELLHTGPAGHRHPTDRSPSHSWTTACLIGLGRSPVRPVSDQAGAARQAFAIRLRDLRKDADLTGRELAALTGLHNIKISRIEHAQQNPSEDDIRAWCIACGVARRIPELIAAHREIEQMWAEHRRETRAGMVHIQSRSTPLYESTRLLRAYESNVVPGILQTRGYVVAALQTSARVHRLSLEDVETSLHQASRHAATWTRHRMSCGYKGPYLERLA
ncbi:MAG: helix-turn-helix domain-containing protein [Pseudonocardiaceae bacterium]